MKDDSELMKTLQRQLAHIMAYHGDKPEELMYKLECLVLEYYAKGHKNDKG